MLKKTITFEDYNGQTLTEDHYFHISHAELIKMSAMEGGYDLRDYMDRLRTERNTKKVMEIFENILKLSYGRKSLDGRKFEKSEEIWNDFYQTEAYSKLFTELVTDAAKAADFCNKIVPKDVSEDIIKAFKENPDGIPAELADYTKYITGDSVTEI